MNYGKDDDGGNDDDGNGDNDDANDNDNVGGFLEHKQKGGTLLQQLPHPDNHSLEEVPSLHDYDDYDDIYIMMKCMSVCLSRFCVTILMLNQALIT